MGKLKTIEVGTCTPSTPAGDNTKSHGTGCGRIIQAQGGSDELRMVISSSEFHVHPQEFHQNSHGVRRLLVLVTVQVKGNTSSSPVIPNAYNKLWSTFLTPVLLTGSLYGALERPRPWLQDCPLPPNQHARDAHALK